MKAVLGLSAALVLLLAVALLPLPIRPYLDFQVIFHADLGLLQGIGVYDHAGQMEMIARLANVTPEQVFVIPFPYPPWYALVTMWLALLPIDVAARLWFGLNLIMLGLSLWVLTDGQTRMRRLVFSVAAIIFPPVLGSLFVGQYVFPVLLGAALLVGALRRRSSALIALSAALLTFKPHLGALMLLVAAVYLWQHRGDVGRRALPWLVGTGAFLFAIGFAASPAWPIDYVRSLTSFEGVSKCGQCTNLSVAIAGGAGGGFRPAVIIAVGLLVVLGIWLAKMWGKLTDEPLRLIGAVVLITLLVSPYLQSYDYVLLLVPFTALAVEAVGIDWLWLALAYVAPFIGLGLFGAAGNMSLVVCALILMLATMLAVARARNRSTVEG